MPECQRLSITVLNIHHLTLAWQPLPGPTQTFLPRSGACLSLPDGAYLTKNMTRRCKLDTVKGRVHYKKERYTLEPAMCQFVFHKCPQSEHILWNLYDVRRPNDVNCYHKIMISKQFSAVSTYCIFKRFYIGSNFHNKETSSHGSIALFKRSSATNEVIW